MTDVLSAEDLHVNYGSIRAIRGVSIHVKEGETIAVVGANGAGKTTLLKALANELPLAGGRIAYKGQDTTNFASHTLASKGLLHIPEGRGTFATMSVRENLRLAFERMKRRPPDSFDKRVDQVFCRFPRLHERQNQLAGSLSGGEQQMLALARVILSPPDLLSLDEPSLGLSPAMVKTVFALIEEFRNLKTTMIVVEQNALASLALADRAYVMRLGKVVLEGRAAEIARDPNLSDHYFGMTTL